MTVILPSTPAAMRTTRRIQAITQDMVEGPAAASLANHPTQSATTIDGWKSFFFGIPFAAIGLFVAAAALNLIPNHSKQHTPNSIIAVFAAFFFLPGAFLILHGLRGILRQAAYKRESAAHPGEPWLADYHWHRQGFQFSAFKSMLGRFVTALMWSAFLIPFFWVGFTQRGAWPFVVVASIFALASLIFWSRWAKMLGEFLRFGNSFLTYDQFPYFLGSSLSARLRVPNHVSDLDQLTLTLRCVAEKYLISGVGRDRNSRVVCYELYKAQTTLSREQLASFSAGEIPVQFRIPADQPPTTLVNAPPTYWEIEASGSSGSLNYQAYFLVPVYSQQ